MITYQTSRVIRTIGAAMRAVTVEPALALQAAIKALSHLQNLPEVRAMYVPMGQPQHEVVLSISACRDLHRDLKPLGRQTMRTALCFSSVILFSACATSSPTPATTEIVIRAIEDVTFSPAMPNVPDGPQLAILWGDPTTGPSAMLLKLKRGPLPLHTHTSDYHLVVLRGTVKHWGIAQTEADAKPLGPGSYWFQPGNVIHADACLADECLVHIVWSGKRDGKLAQADKR